MTIETPPGRRCRARVVGVLSTERMRRTLVIIMVVLALVVIIGLVPLSIRKYPSLAVSVGFVGYTTNTFGSRFALFGITNGCTFPVRRLGCYNAYERRPLDPGSTYTFGPNTILAPGQSELVTVPAPMLQREGPWRAAFLCQREGLSTKFRDWVNNSWFAPEIRSSGPVDLKQTEWIEK